MYPPRDLDRLEKKHADLVEQAFRHDEEAVFLGESE